MGVEDEAIQIQRVIDRLVALFPSVSSAEIESAVHTVESRFDGAAVRTFVPVLIEKAVRQSISGYFGYRDSEGESRTSCQPAFVTTDIEGVFRARRIIVPGLLRGVARTAVIAGTATSVSNRVSRRQGQRWAAQEQEPARQEAPAAPPPPAPAGTDQSARINALKELAALKEQGILTDSEFASEKAKILAS